MELGSVTLDLQTWDLEILGLEMVPKANKFLIKTPREPGNVNFDD